jgi:uncharacterized membrane protein
VPINGDTVRVPKADPMPTILQRIRPVHLGPLLVCLLIVAHAAFFGWLAVMRHESFRSAAMDMGYTDQVVWNTLHGRFMEFSTYENAPIDLPLDQFRRTDNLLSYHVELLLAPISLLYLIYASPATLLVLQAVVIALGALPAFLLARKHLGSSLAGLVFAAAYLMAPALQGALLSDFHAVSLTASLLMFAFYLLDERRYWLFLATICVAILAKEDIPVLVAMMGLYLFFWRRERKIGALTMLLGLGWFLVATKLILPHYSGLGRSPFLDRLDLFGPTPADSLRNALRHPRLVWDWLRQPEISTYASGLLQSGGYMSIFNPLVLVLSAPVLVNNIFSTWSWTYAEGAHYSASVIPFVIVSAIFGVDWLSRQLARRLPLSRRWVAAGLSGVVLVVAGSHQWQIGMTPLARDFRWPQLTPHDRLAGEFIAQIPPDAAVSAQSNLYPHVSHRQKAYLFPAVNDADYIFLDVTSPPDPLDVGGLNAEIQWLFQMGEFEIVNAEDGYLLMRRGEASAPAEEEWRRFLTFARPNARTVTCHPLGVRFADLLELIGYDYTVHNVVTTAQLPVTVTTYWRALKPLDRDYGFAFFFTRDDGAVVGQYTNETPTIGWYPTSVWQPGEVVRIETPVLSVGRRKDVLLAVALPLADAATVEGRLRPVEAADGQGVEILQDASLLRAFSLRADSGSAERVSEAAPAFCLD